MTNIFDHNSLMDITSKPSLLFVRGKGSWLWDKQNKRYLDFVQGWAVNCLGHSPEIIATTLQDQAKTLITPSPAFFNEPSINLANKITQNSSFDTVFFTNSGAEANEGAIKLARKWGTIHKNNAYEIITFHNSFHGRTLATMSASGKPHFKTLYDPKVPGFPKGHINDIDSVIQLISDKTIAIMIEPILGEAGVVIPKKKFFQELSKLQEKHNLLLIVDEIQTGMGRTGSLWGHEQLDLKPDIMTLGKMLGGGVPLSALVATNDVSCFEQGDQGGTFNGNPLMTSVGCVVFDRIKQPGFLEKVTANGIYLTQKLTKLSAHFNLGEVRGKGLLVAMDVIQNKAQDIVAISLGKGLLLNAPRPDILRFMPALNVTKKEINSMIDILATVLEEVF